LKRKENKLNQIKRKLYNVMYPASKLAQKERNLSVTFRR